MIVRDQFYMIVCTGSALIKFLKSIGRKLQWNDLRSVELDETKMDVIIFPQKQWPRMGFVLGNEALILDYKTMTSFRVRSGNLGFADDFHVFQRKVPLNKAFLKQYFLQNNDNPYGIQNIMQLILQDVDITKATQFPPLSIPKLTKTERTKAIKRMVDQARKGDQVFSFTEGSAISSAIRKYDRSQFSHVAIYLGEGKVADIGPAGGQINSLFDSDPNTFFALYTFNFNVPDDVRESMVKLVREKIIQGMKFDFIGIFLMFLKKRFKLPVMKNKSSVADLLYRNIFQLISYL